MTPTPAARRRRRLALAPGCTGLALAGALALPGVPAAAAPSSPPADASGIRHVATVPPTTAGDLPSDLAFWGDYALQGSNQGLRVLDVSRRNAPVVAGELVCPGARGDVAVWQHLAFVSVDSQRNDDSCTSRAFSAAAGDTVPWEGIRVVDWSDPANPTVIRTVATDCGAHRSTLVPDLVNNRVLLYVSSFRPNGTASCQGAHDKISIVEVPLSAPAQAAVIAEPVLFPDGGQPATSGCRDIAVMLAKGLAAGACMGEGVLLDIRDPEQPIVLSSVVDPNFSSWGSVTFTNDGSKVVFGDEVGGATLARCRDTDLGRGRSAVYDVSDPAAPTFLSYLTPPRPQSAQENCTGGSLSVLPVSGRDVVVQSWYQGGISLIDITDPTAPVEAAFYDPAPSTSGPTGLSGSVAAYWYDGLLWSSDLERGLDVFRVTDPVVAGAQASRPGHLNPQTQELLARGASR